MVASPVLTTPGEPRLPRAAKAVDAAKQLGKKVAPAADKAKAKAKEAPATKEAALRKPAAKTAPVKAAAAAPAKAPAAKAPATKSPHAKATPAKASSAKPPADKFLQEQLALLHEERATYEEQAAVLKAQADQMAQEMEPGDIQFDDESGEGGTANIDRERDLALSAQARLAVDEIDHAITKIGSGTYGRCESCGQPIPKARLKALPQARLCVACKSGGLSRR